MNSGNATRIIGLGAGFIILIAAGVYFLWYENQYEQPVIVSISSNNVTNNTNALSTNTKERADTDSTTEEPVWGADVFDQYCPDDILGERSNAYDPYLLGNVTVNTCIYYRESGRLSEPLGYTRDHTGCAETLEKEIADNPYTIVNGCMYHNGDRMFDRTFHSQIEAGEFGEAGRSGSLNDAVIGENADEWFRFEDNGLLTIFFKGVAGCGGCVFNGPYITIDLGSGAVVEKAIDENVAYLYSMVLSPNKKRVVEFSAEENGLSLSAPGIESSNEHIARFYLYDLVKHERDKLLYEHAGTRGFLVCGHGCYLADGVVEWMDDDTVAFQMMATEDEYPYDIVSVVDENGEPVLPRQYVPEGDPVIVEIN